jgi:uncharacterized damage-inducible protein DinB
MQRFIDASRAFLIDEYLPKIRVAVAPLTDEEIWWRPHADSNSIGNLLMHLEGNARQWLLGGVGKMPGMRDRDREFASTGGYRKDELVSKLAATIHDIDAMFSRLTVAELDEARTIQGASTTVFDAIYHVVEHFSGHTGQIILLAKWLAPGAVKLYDASSTSFTPLWKPEPRRQ